MVTSARTRRECLLGSAVTTAEVVVVHRLAEHEVGVGVEAADHLFAVVLEV